MNSHDWSMQLDD